MTTDKQPFLDFVDGGVGKFRGGVISKLSYEICSQVGSNEWVKLKIHS